MSKKTENAKVAPTYPEVGSFKVEKDLKKVYKKMSNEQLDEWLALEGWTDEFKPTESDPINRMRKCMVILYHHFPKAPSKAKTGSPWKAYTLEQLMVMASDHNVEYEFSDHEAILRMRVIMALKAAGITVE